MEPSLCSHCMSFAEDVNVNIAVHDAGEKHEICLCQSRRENDILS